MTRNIVFCLASLIGASSAFAMDLVCEVPQDLGQPSVEHRVTFKVDENTANLQNFVTFNGYEISAAAIAPVQLVVVHAMTPKIQISSTGKEQASLRLESADAVVEAFCRTEN